MSEVNENVPTGTPNWVDIGVPDLALAKEFYNAIFGWDYLEGPPESGGYTLCTVRGKPVAAVMANLDPAADSFWWNIYFSTDDCDGTVKRISDAHGTIVMAPMDVMDQGRMAMAIDPQGAQFGLWQGRALLGAQLVNEPGAFAWNELVTPDTAASAAFYGAVFDRPVEPMGMDGFDYSTLMVGGRPVAGLWGVPDESARWVTYFAVQDADEAARTATARGGSVAKEPQDSPYGRFAVLRDPFGAEFAAMKLAESLPE